MIEQAFAKNYMPSGGGNYKYYKINEPEILDVLLAAHVPVIDAIFEGELLSSMRMPYDSLAYMSALRTDNSYHYLTDVSEAIEKPDSYVSVTGDIIKTIRSMIELSSPSIPKEQLDRMFSMFQEISKEEYEAMITK